MKGNVNPTKTFQTFVHIQHLCNSLGEGFFFIPNDYVPVNKLSSVKE